MTPSFRICPSAVTPAQQTVSPYFRLVVGIALTRTTTREFLGVTDIAAQLIAEKIENFVPTRFQPVGERRVVFKTK